jgi:hypothetical protein
VDSTFGESSGMLVLAAYPAQFIRSLTCPVEQGMESSEHSRAIRSDTESKMGRIEYDYLALGIGSMHAV